MKWPSRGKKDCCLSRGSHLRCRHTSRTPGLCTWTAFFLRSNRRDLIPRCFSSPGKLSAAWCQSSWHWHFSKGWTRALFLHRLNRNLRLFHGHRRGLENVFVLSNWSCLPSTVRKVIDHHKKLSERLHVQCTRLRALMELAMTISASVVVTTVLFQ